MNITQKNIDDLTIIVTIDVDQSDYSEKKKKMLNDYRRNADIKGFRKGMAPMSLIEKTHGRAALLDSINGIVSDGLNNYITENKINIIGEPLPNESEKKKPQDWEREGEFSFSFDLALAPKVELNLSKEDVIPYYEVKIDDERKAKYKENMFKQFGSLQNVDVVGSEEDMLVVDLTQEDTSIEGAYISLRSISDEKIKASFIGKKVGGKMKLDVNKAFENETDRAALLKVNKEELASIDPKYNLVVKEIKRFTAAEESQELYDKMFGEGVIKGADEFDARVVERMKSEYDQESDYRFMIDAREALIEKAAIALPENFLKRWLYTANEEKYTMAEIEKDFDLFLKDFRWQLIRQYITKEQNLTLTREDLLEHARKIAAYQFAMYGLNNVPQEQLDHYAESLLANEKEGRRIYEKSEEDLVIGYVRSVVTLKKKKVTIEKLQEMTN